MERHPRRAGGLADDTRQDEHGEDVGRETHDVGFLKERPLRGNDIAEDLDVDQQCLRRAENEGGGPVPMGFSYRRSSPPAR